MVILWAAFTTRNRYCGVVPVTTPTIDEDYQDYLAEMEAIEKAEWDSDNL